MISAGEDGVLEDDSFNPDEPAVPNSRSTIATSVPGADIVLADGRFVKVPGDDEPPDN